MSLKTSLFGLFFIFSLKTWAQETGGSPELRVGPSAFCLQNLNVYGPFYAPQVKARSEKIAGFLRAPGRRCEVIHLQEAWLESQTDLLASSLGDLYDVSAPNLKNKIGLMSLTLGPYAESQTVQFKKNNEGGLFDQVRARLKIAKAFHVLKFQPVGVQEEIWFVNLHLHQSSEKLRLSQLLEILTWRLEHPESKWVLSGDFNASLEGPERPWITGVLAVRDAMEDVLGGYGKSYCTYCSGNRLGWLPTSKVFDYVFYSPKGGNPGIELKPVQGEVNMYGTAAAPWSDHYGVRVGFEMRAPEVLSPQTLAATAATGQSLETQKQAALSSLLKSEVLLGEEPEQFADELKQIADLKNQLLQESGPYWDYLQQNF